MALPFLLNRMLAIVGNSIILTKQHPSELSDIEKAEAFQISLLGRSTGEQRVKEQHGWWNEREQEAEFLATTFEPETPLPFVEARRVYFESDCSTRARRVCAFAVFQLPGKQVHYRDLRKAAGTS